MGRAVRACEGFKTGCNRLWKVKWVTKLFLAVKIAISDNIGKNREANSYSFLAASPPPTPTTTGRKAVLSRFEPMG